MPSQRCYVKQLPGRIPFVFAYLRELRKETSRGFKSIKPTKLHWFQAPLCSGTSVWYSIKTCSLLVDD